MAKGTYRRVEGLKVNGAVGEDEGAQREKVLILCICISVKTKESRRKD